MRLDTVEPVSQLPWHSTARWDSPRSNLSCQHDCGGVIQGVGFVGAGIAEAATHYPQRTRRIHKRRSDFLKLDARREEPTLHFSEGTGIGRRGKNHSDLTRALSAFEKNDCVERTQNMMLSPSNSGNFKMY